MEQGICPIAMFAAAFNPHLWMYVWLMNMWTMYDNKG